jgi:hypothetical protein
VDMAARMRDTRNRRLKRQVACNAYAVDPQQVATAIIVKLVQGDLSAPDPLAGGPSRRGGGIARLRRAA